MARGSRSAGATTGWPGTTRRRDARSIRRAILGIITRAGGAGPPPHRRRMGAPRGRGAGRRCAAGERRSGRGRAVPVRGDPRTGPTPGASGARGRGSAGLAAEEHGQSRGGLRGRGEGRGPIPAHAGEESRRGGSGRVCRPDRRAIGRPARGEMLGPRRRSRGVAGRLLGIGSRSVGFGRGRCLGVRREQARRKQPAESGACPRRRVPAIGPAGGPCPPGHRESQPQGREGGRQEADGEGSGGHGMTHS